MRVLNVFACVGLIAALGYTGVPWPVAAAGLCVCAVVTTVIAGRLSLEVLDLLLPARPPLHAPPPRSPLRCLLTIPAMNFFAAPPLLRTLGRITELVLTELLQVRDAITATIGALISPSVLTLKD